MENHKRSLLRLRLRVTAKKRGRNTGSSAAAARKLRERASANSFRKLLSREIGGAPRMGRATSSNAPEKFRNIQLQEEFDTYDHNVHMFVKLQFLKKRSKIIEIVAAKDVIFALAQSGLCAAFSRTSNKRICFLNISPDEVIRSLFYNKNNDSLITVSVYASDHFSSLKCRTTPIEYIRRNQLDAGFPLFETESLKWPGFVEFDDVNGKVLTYSAQDGIYKVFDLRNYNYLYSISDKNIQEIKISPGIMLLIFNRTQSSVPLKILSIEDGIELKSFNHMLHRNKKVDFIEQFNEKLLVKQENENLQILDVRNSELTEVCKTEFMTPSAFIFLYENHLFLTFRNRTVAVWNFRGELVTSFEDHLLWHPDCNTNNIYITSDQDLIISYCKAVEEGEDDCGVSAVGSINMSNILTGKCIAKICSTDRALLVSPRKNGDPGRSSVRSTVKEALEDVTALFYDEDRNEIYTGQSKMFASTNTRFRNEPTRSTNQPSHLNFENKRCECRRRAAVKISESKVNPAKLYYNCATNTCDFFEWCHPLQENHTSQQSVSHNETTSESRIASDEMPQAIYGNVKMMVTLCIVISVTAMTMAFISMLK